MPAPPLILLPCSPERTIDNSASFRTHVPVHNTHLAHVDTHTHSETHTLTQWLTPTPRCILSYPPLCHTDICTHAYYTSAHMPAHTLISTFSTMGSCLSSCSAPACPFPPTTPSVGALSCLLCSQGRGPYTRYHDSPDPPSSGVLFSEGGRILAQPCVFMTLFSQDHLLSCAHPHCAPLALLSGAHCSPTDPWERPSTLSPHKV